MTLHIMLAHFKRWFIFPIVLLCSGCINTTQIKSFISPEPNSTSARNELASSATFKSVLQDRIIKTRTFYTPDKKVIGQALIATLLDQGYQIDYTSSDYKLITAHKNFSANDRILASLTFQENDNEFVTVRANFSLHEISISSEQQFYQIFFSALSKSIFLRTNGIL